MFKLYIYRSFIQSTKILVILKCFNHKKKVKSLIHIQINMNIIKKFIKHNRNQTKF